MSNLSRGPKEQEQLRSIAFTRLGQQQVPSPLVRITTCGLLTIERLEEIVSTDPPLARYEMVVADTLHGRGVAPTLTLLKLLLSRPERFASRDWLTEQFCQEREEPFSHARLDNLASLLRSLLCPPAYELLRTKLVALRRSSAASGDGYQLLPYPLIWVDQEALTWYVAQAARMERFGDDPLPSWERAFSLARRGEYFPDERYSDWATARRAEVAGMLRQCVQALARLYLACHGQAGQEEALFLLRSYWQEHPTDEDVLRLLMELLGQRECFQEACEYYERCRALLEDEGRQPDPRTVDVAEHVRLKQVQRPSLSMQRYAVSTNEKVSNGGVGDVFQTNSYSPLLHIPHFPLPSILYKESPLYDTSGDWSIWAGLKAAQFVALIDAWSGNSVYYEQLQAILDRELRMFHTTIPSSGNEVALHSRRQALVAIATLPATFSALSQQVVQKSIVELTLSRCAASITALWHLLKGNDLALVEQILSTYLFTLVALAQQNSPYQKSAAKLTSQAYRLIGIVALHRNNLQAREYYCQQALVFSKIADDTRLIVSAYTSLASTYYYLKEPIKAAHLYQEALTYKEHISPLQIARLHAELAVVFAQQMREQEALTAHRLAQEGYPEHPESDASFLYAEFSPSSLLLEEGLTYLALAHTFPGRKYEQEALQRLSHIETFSRQSAIPERILYEITNRQAEAALLVGERDLFLDYIEKGLKGARLLKSKQRHQEVKEVFSQAELAWPTEVVVKRLSTQVHEAP